MSTSSPVSTTQEANRRDGDTKSKPVAIRTFDIAISSSKNVTIRITEPALLADNLPLETWASSSILAAELHKHPITFPTSHLIDFSSPPPPSPSPVSPNIIPILELGAGTGLVGLTASLLHHHPTILTDLPPIVPGLVANIALNNPLFPRSHPPILAGVLDWTCPTTLSLPSPSPLDLPASSTKAHVILAADTLYSADHPLLLTDTVTKWLSRDKDARFVMATALRVAYLEELRELWERLEGAGLACLDEGKGMAREEDFDDERLVEWSFWAWKQESGETGV
ncbi:Protein-lysine N-methyltransferase rrg1 [Sphaceloma murrayae]|uniref:Protein-lysine N-methyltransferase rrg1 n=1 Tax=Sphaceloma murrayae TaxID=2082308 RepID=A0A2K1R3D4_9PEZI|nr:Protein-lysine N-methyltransferase rrg1 [Sphaceloma murrayae]